MTETTRKNTLSEDVAHYLSICTAFDALLEKETAALHAVDFEAVDALQNEKRHLAKDYNHIVTTLAQRKDEFARLPEQQRTKIITTRTAFTRALDANMRALTAAQDGAKRVVDRILDAARSAVTQETHTHYSSTGKTQAYKTASMSLSVDQSL
ncbi:MAG: DUF3723 domain-containing protein [Alphaproteobacteria bacterium]|nr:DUF3723 domain-containing protein [Alphaproteobacteria bacterium]